MRITKLDGLRGVFSLMVVVYHYPKEFIPGFIHDFFLVAKSYLFVDFFFVLSGFVISYNYNNHINTKTELGTFMKKRFIRLYPLLFYTTFMFLFMVLGVKLFLPQFAQNKDSFLPAILDTVSTLSFLNSTPIFDENFGGNRYGMNFPSWSISAEMFAYFFFGVITLWAVTKRKNRILASSIFIGMLFLFLKSLFEMPGNFDFVRGIVSFNIGYFVYLYSHKPLKISNRREVILLVLFFALFFAASIAEAGPMLTFIDACIIPFFFGLFIYTLLYTDGVVSRLMDTKVFQFLGKVSYSIYLNHALVIAILPRVAFSVLKLQPTVTMEIAILILNILALLVYSNITYNLIEVKGGDLLKRMWLKRKPAVVPVVNSEKV